MKAEEEKKVEAPAEVVAEKENASKKAAPKKEIPVAKPSAMEAEFEHLAGYQTKIRYSNLRVVLHIGTGTPTEEQIDLPHVAGSIKAHFLEK